jgi:hypothetical protein
MNLGRVGFMVLVFLVFPNQMAPTEDAETVHLPNCGSEASDSRKYEIEMRCPDIPPNIDWY